MFAGNNGNIFFNGGFNLLGGAFIASAATMQVTGGYNFSGGSFNHNNGTVSFSTGQSITGSTTFYNLLFVANGGVYAITPGTILGSTNNVTINGGSSCTINNGTVEIKGNLSLLNSSNNSVNGGSTTFLFNGTGNQNISSSVTTLSVGINEKVCCLPNVEINKTSGNINLSGVINVNGSSWKTNIGSSLINSGTSTVNIISNITFSGQNLSLYAIHILANGKVLTLSPASYTLTATNNLLINGSNYFQVNTGVIELLGDLTLINSSTSAINGGSGTFLFDGIGIQNIISSASSLNFVCALPNIQINKNSGTLNLSGIINFNGSSWNTIAGNTLVNTGTATLNVLRTATLSGQNLSFYDIVVTGNFSTITLGSTLMWTSTHLLTFAGGGSWYQLNGGTLNAKGDVLIINTNSSNNVGGNSTLLIDGTANQTLIGSGIAGAGRLPKVLINKTGGTLTFSNIISVDNNWTYIAGIVDAFTNAATIDFYKTAILDGQGSSATMAFHHVIVSGLISLGGNLDANGDFTIRSGVNNRLDVSTGNYQLNIEGNWTNNNSTTPSSFNQQNGKVVFDGSGSQILTLASASHTESFYNLEINNNNIGLTLNGSVSILNNINFIFGNIISSASNSLLINNLATSTGASNFSFVFGPVYKMGNQAFQFPIGKNAAYAPLVMSAPSLSTNQFVAEYFETDADAIYSVAIKDASLVNISRCEYWVLNEISGASTVSVGLSWDTRSCGVTNISDLRVASWNGTQWKDMGNSFTSGNSTNGALMSYTLIGWSGPFTLASTTILNPLPIELISFTSLCDKDAIILKWRTITERNNDYFTIEHSTNGQDWNVIATVKGSGNSSVTKDYVYNYMETYKNISYYRLKQTDFNKQFKYFNIIAVKPCKDGGEVDIKLYPNPSNGTFNFLTVNEEMQIDSIEIVNIVGQKVYFSVYQSMIILSDQPAGVYLVIFNLRSGNKIRKVINVTL